MQARRRTARFIFAITAVIAAGCTNDSGVSVTDGTGSDTSNSTPSTDNGSADTIEWEECTDELVIEATLQCATLTVPLDYDQPEGDTLDIALVRAPATADREGAVLFNPGGPGGSGFDPIAVNGTYLQAELGLEHFDIIGFDPRGVERSGGIACVDDAFQDAHLYLDDTPDTPEEQALLDGEQEAFVDACLAEYGDTLPLYSTANTARDMDLIRAGLGDDQLSYLGISYGTYLGAVYATLFPQQVRAMVLDSAMDPDGDTIEQQYLTQLVGFEGAFNDWASWCEEGSECAFADVDVAGRWDALRLQLDEQPLTSEDGREINQATLERATTAALYSESQWPVLAEAVADAENGDGAAILALADDYNGRHADGTYDTLFQSLRIIRCASGINTQLSPDPEDLLAKILDQAPRFGKGITLDDLSPADGDVDGCLRLTGEIEPVEIDYSGDGPIVVVGGSNDPATPIRWAEEMTASLGDRATMVTFTGEGHGQLLASSCVTDIEGALLAELTQPADGTTCDPDPPVERPAWFDDIDYPTGFSGVVPMAAVGAALGLSDTLGYGEVRTTTLTAQQAAEAIDAAFTDAGFINAGNQDLGIDDTIEIGFLNADNELLIVVIMGPAAFDTDALASAKASVPPDTTVVLIAYLPQ
ncbi:MAG: alpha/beta fold hydrolase [Actinomycetota bacterium]|nr:alpha/beta fold hydrolase [Actinomycetota bacterium]